MQYYQTDLSKQELHLNPFDIEYSQMLASSSIIDASHAEQNMTLLFKSDIYVDQKYCPAHTIID